MSSPVSVDRSAEPSLQFLHFELESMRIALPVTIVQEIVRAVAISPLPQAPPSVEGVINARGTLVPVFDLRRRFDLPASPLSLHQQFVLAYAGRRLTALRVNRVVGLVEVAVADVAPPGDVVTRADHVAAIARLADGVLVIQDLERFLSPAEADQVDAALISALSRSGTESHRSTGAT